MEGQNNLFLPFEIAQVYLLARVRREGEVWSLLPNFCCHLITSISTAIDFGIVYQSIR
jgi:hypothetical protein